MKNRRRLSETRALRVLKEVAEALNSAPTEQRAASEALSRMADLLGVRDRVGLAARPGIRPASTTPPCKVCRLTCRSQCA